MTAISCRRVQCEGYDLGLQIVRTLTEIELGGSFSFGNEDGQVAAHIRCPVKRLEVTE